MKVLIVVDDVEEQSHLHAIVGDQLRWFGPGSRIIVTSQKEEILKEYDAEKVRTYMVGKLDDGQAFKLFCEHAFGMQSPVPDYDGHANCVVNATEKLPLAVEVVGSFLRGKSIQEWEKMEESMKLFTMRSQKTTVGLEEMLDICYKELEQQQKDIFLDIACFISGVDARIASYMWPNCYLPSSCCILMPLAKIGENNELQMHRLLRCLGKRILNQEGSGDPIGRKFYIQDMVPKAISREKGMENVEALSFDFTAGHFQRMPDIMFLKLDNAKVSGDFAGAFASLRWLCWQRCPLEFDAFNFVLRELVILDLSWSKVTEDWGGWSEFKMEKLKVLNLTGCSDLLITPNFSGYKDLEILILERCSRLVKLDPSIGHLKRLVSLNLKFCSRFYTLPDELGCLTALKELFIDGTSVREIPISIGNLKKLEILSGFNISSIPSEISTMSSLQTLDLLQCNEIEVLPKLSPCLIRLRMSSKRMKATPLLKDLKELEELCLSDEDPTEHRTPSEQPMPESNVEHPLCIWFSRLWNLELLQTQRIDEQSFSISFPKLRKLELSLSQIIKLKFEPTDIPQLKTLTLSGLRLEEVSELPKTLSVLSIQGCSSLKRLPTVQGLNNLSVFELYHSAIEEIEGLEGLKALKRLDISNCKIQNLNGIGQLTSLRSLILSDCDYLRSLPDLSNLKLLKVLEIRRCEMIRQIEGIEKLTSLKKLDISKCPAENTVQVQNVMARLMVT
ncbi:hypothetical protein NL676_034236 [Syzygium grande]|nr:hypothetical protein NL676_034236 [Syzygium grande]